MPGMLPWQGIRGQHVAVCVLIYFYVHEEPLNEAGPRLSRLLSYITRLIPQVDAGSPNMQHFLSLLASTLQDHDDDSDEASAISTWVHKIDALIQDSSSFSGLHCFFTKVERLLLTEELYDDIKNVTIKPADRLIDEQSPMGHYIQQCLDHYLGLEDDEFAYVVRSVQRWVAGGEETAESIEEHAHSSDDAANSALRKGDYSLARSELEGFFNRSPLDWTNQSLQDTLFKNAYFHYQTRAYQSARASLDEALRLSRSVNDLTCITACDNLLQRLDDEEDSEKWAPYSRVPLGLPTFALQSLWQVQREVDRGRPLLCILASLDDLPLRRGRGRVIAPVVERILPLEGLAECCLTQARVWTGVGIGGIASAFLDASIRESCLISSPDCTKLMLPIACLQSDALAEAGRINEALAVLFDFSLVQSLDMAHFSDWQATVWRTMYKSTLEAGAVDTKRAIRAVRPEVVREIEGHVGAAWSLQRPVDEPNEASFGRNDKVTMPQQLLGRLKEAKILREEAKAPAISLTIASQAMRRAEDSHLFCVYRQAILECSESLLALGNASRAKEVLEDIMPQLLLEKKAVSRGKAAWLYARALLSLHDQRGREEVESVLPWLRRARTAFTESRTLLELSDVLYVEGRLFHDLGMQREEQEVKEEFERVLEEYNNGNGKREGWLFDTVQSMVMLAGAKVVAGD